MLRVKNVLPAMLLCFSSFLQAQQYPFVYYTPKDGLVSTRARSMFQDSEGRLYITTFGGLSVYDGARFTNYTTNNGLADNLVNAVMEMGDDSLWVILNTNRIQCLVHGRLKNYVTADGFVPVVNKLTKHSKGLYYALTDEGIFKFQDNRFTRVDIKDKNGRTLNRYFNRGIEAGNKLIIVTDPAISQYPSPSYLIVCDVATGKASVSAKPPEIFDVIESPQNEVLVSTSMGIKMLDKNALKKNEIVFTDLPL